MTPKHPNVGRVTPPPKHSRIEISLEKSLLLKFNHLIHAEFENSEKEQRLRLFFATHEVVVRGNMRRRIETALQRMELSYLVAVPKLPVSDG